jgi:hypothetical protein
MDPCMFRISGCTRNCQPLSRAPLNCSCFSTPALQLPSG